METFLSFPLRCPCPQPGQGEDGFRMGRGVVNWMAKRAWIGFRLSASGDWGMSGCKHTSR